MLTGHRLHTDGKETVGDVRTGARIGRNSHQLAPLSARIAGLFEQFAACGGLRFFVLLHHAGHNLEACLPQRVAILADEKHTAIAGDGYDIDPIGIFQHIIFIIDSPCRQFDGVPAGRQPRPADDIFAPQSLPRHVASVHLLSLHIISLSVCGWSSSCQTTALS